MPLNASRSRELIAWLAGLGGAAVIAAALSDGRFRAQAGEPTAAPAGIARAARAQTLADRFPNVVLKTHQGKNVRFYDDLLKGKIVLINFMYATCKGR